MSTTTATFNKKSLYHSDLAKAGELVLMFTGDPRDSTFKGKPKFCGLKIQGDDTAYTLNVENADVEATITNTPKNTWFSVRAEGRGEQAFLLIEDGNGSPILKGDTVPAQPRRSAIVREREELPPPNEWAENEHGQRITPVTVTLAAEMTIDAVKLLEKAGIRVDSDAAARIYNTHYIQASRG